MPRLLLVFLLAGTLPATAQTFFGISDMVKICEMDSAETSAYMKSKNYFAYGPQEPDMDVYMAPTIKASVLKSDFQYKTIFTFQAKGILDLIAGRLRDLKYKQLKTADNSVIFTDSLYYFVLNDFSKDDKIQYQVGVVKDSKLSPNPAPLPLLLVEELEALVKDFADLGQLPVERVLKL